MTYRPNLRHADLDAHERALRDYPVPNSWLERHQDTLWAWCLIALTLTILGWVMW